MDKNESNIIALIWSVIGISLLLSLFYAPVSSLMTLLISNKIHFVFLVALPGLIIILLFTYLILLNAIEQQKGKFYSANWQLGFLILWCLFVVLMTGGISNSPLSSLVAIVPLISAPYFSPAARKKTMVCFLFGILVVGVLSSFSLFNPPKTYPQGWEYSGEHNNIIVMGILLVGLVLEIKIIDIVAIRGKLGTVSKKMKV